MHIYLYDLYFWENLRLNIAINSLHPKTEPGTDDCLEQLPIKRSNLSV